MKGAVIVTSAGSSDRFNSNSGKTLKKEFVLINNHSVLYNSVKNFVDVCQVSCIAITYKAGTLEQTKQALEDLTQKKHFIFVEGGSTRQQSVFNALKTLDCECKDIDWVAIHDGARPYVSYPLICKTIEDALQKGAAAPAVPVRDTLVEKTDSDSIGSSLDRSKIMAVQTPQVFPFKEILKAHESANEKAWTFTDDTQLYSAFGKEVFLTEGDVNNIKITYLDDLKKMSRVGYGWDIHKLVIGRDLVLGGVKIPNNKGCLGHSDGDALTHAIIDAMLGAAGLSDIGTQFPDTDEQYKDICSMILLRKTCDMLCKKGLRIINIDATVILQTPKLGPDIKAIKESLSSVLGIPADSIGIKAKTAEHMLGELGSGDAVCAMAIVLLSD